MAPADALSLEELSFEWDVIIWVPQSFVSSNQWFQASLQCFGAFVPMQVESLISAVVFPNIFYAELHSPDVQSTTDGRDYVFQTGFQKS